MIELVLLPVGEPSGEAWPVPVLENFLAVINNAVLNSISNI